MVTCEEYWDLLSDEREGGILSLRNSAQLDTWRTCQQCGNRVERSAGGNRMTCWYVNIFNFDFGGFLYITKANLDHLIQDKIR